MSEGKPYASPEAECYKIDVIMRAHTLANPVMSGQLCLMPVKSRLRLTKDSGDPYKEHMSRNAGNDVRDKA
jgi:hypothetical protein